MDAILRDTIFQIELSELLDQNWFKIGAFLKVEQIKLVGIRDDCIVFRRQDNKAHAMIQKWLEVNKNATFEDLKLAIESIPNYILLKKVEDLAYTFLNKSSSSQNNITNQPNDTSGINFEPKSDWFVKMLANGPPNPGFPTYPIKPNSRGLCVILCNSLFEKFSMRDGADVDVNTLAVTFSKLNFKVKIKENKSRNQMDRIIRKCGNEKDVNCFVCFISSHGSLEAVAGNDGELLTFKEMRSAINDNPGNFLKKIPKIFFIQACQGKNYLKIYEDSIDTKSLGELDSKPESIEASVDARNADYCFSVATTPDDYAWRTKNGTVYFQTLCCIINKLLETNEQISLMNILFQLNGEMGNWISKNASELRVDPNSLKANLCNIAYCTLSGDVWFEKKR